MGNDELHPKIPITYVFNVKFFPHVCSFCHGFGHLLVKVQPILQVSLPLINPPIVLVPSYPNIVPRNFGSHLGIGGDRGEFLGFSNPT